MTYTEGRVKRWPIWGSLDRTTECWIWQGSVGSHGYGQVNHEGKPRLVHRVSYEEAYGRIPPGIVIDHKCCEPRCARPAHLQAVTSARNAELTAERGRTTRSRTHCKWGHPFTAENTYWNGARRFCRTCGNRRSAIWQRTKRKR